MPKAEVARRLGIGRTALYKYLAGSTGYTLSPNDRSYSHASLRSSATMRHREQMMTAVIK
ncbi:hypothetical protein [Corynebacterium afermentans]|uniref:hypothetical protein n=1 Tax=Corynebacterium afermentans TaxID=38286 RepID=UPI0030B85204